MYIGDEYRKGREKPTACELIRENNISYFNMCF